MAAFFKDDMTASEHLVKRTKKIHLRCVSQTEKISQIEIRKILSRLVSKVSFYMEKKIQRTLTGFRGLFFLQKINSITKIAIIILLLQPLLPKQHRLIPCLGVKI